MTIKRITILSCLIFLFITCHAQQTDSVHSIKVPEYRVNPCLANLLMKVARSNKRYYDADKYFYSVALTKGVNYNYLHIEPGMWDDPKHLDYKGVFKYRDVFFLLRGDFDQNPIFLKDGILQSEVKLRQHTDSLSGTSSGGDPSLYGMFSDCVGMSIYVEVYTKGKVEGVEMKITERKPVNRD